MNDSHTKVDEAIRAIRNRKVNGWTRDQIVENLSKHFSAEILFLAWAAAEIADKSLR